MEDFPDDDGRSAATGSAHGSERPRAAPNLWILIGITGLSLLITVVVLVLTAVSP